MWSIAAGDAKTWRENLPLSPHTILLLDISEKVSCHPQNVKVAKIVRTFYSVKRCTCLVGHFWKLSRRSIFLGHFFGQKSDQKWGQKLAKKWQKMKKIVFLSILDGNFDRVRLPVVRLWTGKLGQFLAQKTVQKSSKKWQVAVRDPVYIGSWQKMAFFAKKTRGFLRPKLAVHEFREFLH